MRSGLGLPLIVALLAVCVLMPGGGNAVAGEVACATVQETPQHILDCPGGLKIIGEGGARFTIEDRDDDGSPDAVNLLEKALLLELTGEHRDVEVVTPQAIAAVRGTKWVVDVGSDKTSVFVARGKVDVTRQGGGEAVSLKAGDGVDVTAGSDPLKVKQWPAKRVDALMARLGQ